MRGKEGGPSLEVLLRIDDGTRGQSTGSGQAEDPGLGSVLVGPHESFGTTSQWAYGPSDVFGPYPPTASPREFGPSYPGLPHDYGWASNKLIGGSGLGVRGPASSLDLDLDEAHLGGARPLNGSGPSSLGGHDQSRSLLWVIDGLWRPSAEKQSLEENSKTDDALMEEASRYGIASNFFGPLVCVSPSSPFFFWSDSIGGVLRPFWGGFGRIPEGIFGPEDDWKGVFSAGDCESLGTIGR